MLQNHIFTLIRTIHGDWLMRCPKKALPNHMHKALIFLALYRGNMLTKKAYFFGRMALWHQITRIPSKPLVGHRLDDVLHVPSLRPPSARFP